MQLTRKHMEESSLLFLVYLQFIVILSFLNLQSLNLIGLATAATVVVRGNDTDQEALLQFKAKITGDQLGIMESWNSSVHFCQWPGVACSLKHQRVTKLGLSYLKLSGSLSPFVGNLSFLRDFNLAGNSFYNHIPQELGRLRRLERLGLSRNSFSGEIPSNLSACSKLTLLTMSRNQLTGEIPTLLSHLTNLKILFIYKSRLTGNIPPSFGNLSSLEKLKLSGNALSGSIPEALGRLSNLWHFSITQNAISGIVPAAMFNLSYIRVFDISGNKIQGTLPSNLAITMPFLRFFSVWGNKFSGHIPISISNASNLHSFQITDNGFSGNVPSLEKLDKLSVFHISKNSLGHETEDDLNFFCTLVNNTNLEKLSISYNNFGGVFPECISNFSISIGHLSMGGNKISGRIPGGIGNLINLEKLRMQENHLSGPIPFAIGRLRKLDSFFAHQNFLSGTIPHSIGNLTVLTELRLCCNNLQGSIPSSLGRCQNLLLLRISRNNLSGPIPPEVIGISSLSIILDLSSNHLTGELPVEVEKLKHLGSLHVSHNRLSGLLPKSLDNCVSLEKLFLKDNLFEGPIPSSWSSLRGLEALDLSINNLSGSVPEFLVSFRALKYLNLSFNDFEGMIPSEGVFKNASVTFVEGNNKLCGGIPQLNLSRCNSKVSLKSSIKIAIVAVSLGVALVFTCFLILWFSKKKKKPIAICEENSLLRLSYQSILKATDGFSELNLLGSGSFGSVYKGILEDSGATIAVKVVNLLNRGASRSFLAECEALKNIRHRNLVKVLTAISGIDYQGNDFKALVYEFMANGSLENWLHPSMVINELETRTRGNLNFSQRVCVAIDVAHALEYLHHHCETPIIHCDLKPSNILLDEDMVGHISDFGLAKLLSTDMLNNSANHSSSLGLRGTIGYAPPEYGMGSELSTNGDVYSYGIFLLEMFSGKRPTDEMFREGFNLHNFVKAALPERMIEIVDPFLLQERVRRGTIADIILSGNNLGNERHLQCLVSIFEIGLACSFESPSQRIDMRDVVAKLCSIRNELHPTRREIRI